jgi:hypothetical protein
VVFLLLGASAAAASVGHPTGGAPAPRQASRTLLTTGQGPTSRGNDSRDGWYPEEAGLSPTLVKSPNFGQVFATQLNGQIYAQPLLVGHILLVATELDWVYGLNSVSGKIEWKRHIGNAFADDSLGCADLTPDLGVTSTPVVNPATGIAYLVDQSYISGDSGPVAWYMNAINTATGEEVPHFPVKITGPPVNDPTRPFVAKKEMQRPGLLLLGNVVYAAFGSHCDFLPYTGIIVGVSTSGKQTTMWSDQGTAAGQGSGIWQAGGGLVSDGANQILFASGNGFGSVSDPSGLRPASSPPQNLGDSVVRLVVQPNGSLKPTNFFSMYDDGTVDSHDWDLTGAPVVLPSQFSTHKYPRLVVTSGKQGIVYLLNADSLGGAREGPGKRDLVLGEYGPNGAADSTAGAWPGNGGYVYISTFQGVNKGPGEVDVYKFEVTSKGVPALRLVGNAGQNAVFGVSGPLVTSNGTASGSAVVWFINGASLFAYGAVPVNGKLPLLHSWFDGVNDAFTPPGIGNNMVYVGSQDGMLFGFGKMTPPAPGAQLALP